MAYSHLISQARLNQLQCGLLGLAWELVLDSHHRVALFGKTTQQPTEPHILNFRDINCGSYTVRVASLQLVQLQLG